jgi:serine/threonine protein phosphatase 1
MKQVILRLERNRKGRDFVCGDIHGCFDELEAGLEEIRFNPAKDRLFCVGDLIDRGPRSQDALKYYRKNWLYTVLGNHEDMFSRMYARYGLQFARYDFRNGNKWIVRQSQNYLDELWAEIQELPLIIKIEDVLILHARLPDVDTLEEIEAFPEGYMDFILWSREGLPNAIAVPGISRIYCGHTIVDEPVSCKGTINLDTGAFLAYWQGYSGRLTMLPLWD